VTAEVHHGRLELAQLAEQIERLDCPPGLELEAVAIAAALELRLDRTCFFAECERVRSGGIGGEKQDGVLFHDRLRRRGLLRWG